jgi:hypothetical protein
MEEGTLMGMELFRQTPQKSAVTLIECDKRNASSEKYRQQRSMKRKEM